jgi:putative DNA methylase
MTVVRKKLIEVALPLEAINKASAHEKSIRHGHPSTLHLWWARRPLAAARAVIFAQMVDDPSSYADELLAIPRNKPSSTEELERRRSLWSEREALYEKAGLHAQTTVPPPGPEPTLEECAADLERERLFVIIRQLVLWENTTNKSVLSAAREEIWKSWRRTCADNKDHPRAREAFNPDKLPSFHDPFAGGGALPLEAQRLGLEAYGSDLNPVAVLINKALIEIPPKFAGREAVNPESQRQKAQMGKFWSGAQGLAEDVRYYGQWIHDEAEKRIGPLYPKIEVTEDMTEKRPDLRPLVGQRFTVIAWLWARTVKSPNPAFSDVDVPLVSNFMLFAKTGREAYVEPVVEGSRYHFRVLIGKPENLVAVESGTKLARANFRCLVSGTPISGDYIRTEAQAGRMGSRMMAIVADSAHGRLYLPPTPEMEDHAAAEPTWKPDVEFFPQALGFRIANYGMTRWSDLFTARQLVALTAFSDLVNEARERVERDAIAAGLPGERITLQAGGTGAAAYADAVATYLGETVSKIAAYHCSMGIWRASDGKTGRLFGRQAISMVWDFPECNPFAGAGGDWQGACADCCKVLAMLGTGQSGYAWQHAAQDAQEVIDTFRVVSTDPPYYDNVGYADLSDFFYVWLRRSFKPLFPNLFATVSTPKTNELVATPHRHGGKELAESFFLGGMTQALGRLVGRTHPAFPVTIYYAFKQSESEGEEGTASTGWETFLEAVVLAGFSISGTWPMRTEQSAALKATRNALASSIVLVCRPRAMNAPTATRREFITALKTELPVALAHLQRGNIAPVDLAQAAIGPGMAVYTQFASVFDASGKPLTVRDALALINQMLDEALASQEGDFDADTRWTLAWFEQSGFAQGEYGVAETLSKAKNTSIAGLVEAGILASKSGKVRLLRPDELSTTWDPTRDPRLTTWEIVHQLIRVLESKGEAATAELVSKLGSKAEIARELAYRLYNLCERNKRAQEALAYNGLVQSWPEILRMSREIGVPQRTQAEFFRENED